MSVQIFLICTTGARAKVKELRMLEYPKYAMQYAEVF
jgi:hypothetical protein